MSDRIMAQGVPLKQLGCGKYEVLINDRLGTPTIARLTGSVERLEYSRLLDDTSSATVTLNMTCCEDLQRLAPLRHTLMILRDGKVVWEGLLLNIDDGGSRLTEAGRISTSANRVGIEVATLEAFDFTAWWNVRAVRQVFDHTVETGDGAIDPILYAEELIRHGMEPDDPGLLEHMLVIGGAPPFERRIDAFGGMVAEEIIEAARFGLDYTAIGRRWVLFPATTPLGSIGPLSDEHFQQVPRIVQSGGDFVSKAIVSGDGVIGQAGGIDPFYGLVERLYEEDRVTTSSGAFQSATARVRDGGQRVPTYIAVDRDTYLTSTAPVTMEDLVPGVYVHMLLAKRCTPIAHTFKLVGVRAVWDPDGEKIGLNLAPLEESEAEVSRTNTIVPQAIQALPPIEEEVFDEPPVS